VPKADVPACPESVKLAAATVVTEPTAEVATKVEGVTLASASTLTEPKAEVAATPDMVKLTGIEAGSPQGPVPHVERPQPDIY